nr:MAG TPA: hypothetical protein [Caudoviricetes sp.]
MKNIGYEKLEEIVVKSQEELDMISLNFKGRIYIEFGTYFNRAIVKNNYYNRVVARENSTVEARENSSVEARENSSVVARENSSVVARGNSSVVARENSSVVARENSSVVAWENSTVEARENSSVVARENSSVVAQGNCQVVDCSDIYDKPKIKISGNARIVYNPKNITEYMDFYNIKHTKTKATFYKAVRKRSGKYISDYKKDFEYEIGKMKRETCDTDVNESCSNGIHISNLNWALRFGATWDDLAIIEVETKIKDIVVPLNTDGKVRTSEVKVIREVPLGECGLYGKIIERRRNNVNS